MQALPYFVGEPGPIGVDGEGNYVIKLLSADESRTHLFTLYFLDSHAYASSLNPWNYEYDYIKQSQIDWFKNESQAIRNIERPFVPPTLENSTFGLLGDDERRKRSKTGKKRLITRQEASTLPALAKPNAMAIFHIPLAEVYDAPPDSDAKTGDPLVFGNTESGRGAAKVDKAHFFDKAVLMQTELGSRVDTLDSIDLDEDPEVTKAILNAKPEVKVILNGHCHVSDACRRISVSMLVHRTVNPVETPHRASGTALLAVLAIAGMERSALIGVCVLYSWKTTERLSGRTRYAQLGFL